MSKQQRGIQTVELAGEILQLICRSPKSLSLSEIAEAMQLPPGSAYKYLFSLLKTGLLKRNPNTLEFEAGHLSLRLGLSKISHDPYLKYASQELSLLADKYHINVFASMWSRNNGATVVFYKQAGGFFHIGFRLGIRLSLTRTASGRIFSAYLPASLIKQSQQAISENDYDIFNSNEFQKIVENIKELGYSNLVDYPTPGISSFSVPVFNANNELIMSISAFNKSEIFTSTIEEKLIEELKNIAEILKGL